MAISKGAMINQSQGSGIATYTLKYGVYHLVISSLLRLIKRGVWVVEIPSVRFNTWRFDTVPWEDAIAPIGKREEKKSRTLKWYIKKGESLPRNNTNKGGGYDNSL